VPEDVVSVNRLELIGFYDNPVAVERGVHATAINAIAGEELGLTLLLDCLTSSGVDASIIPGPCTTGRRSGHRLDGWVRTPQVAYQVEVKNWSSHSFGGTKLPVEASQAELEAHRVRVWNEYWTGTTFADAGAAKVLERMRAPLGCAHVEPLIVFWPSMHPNGLPEPLFRIPLQGHGFEQVTVFSMSSYLRGMDCGFLYLPLPKTVARLAILDRIFDRNVNGRP